MIDPLIDSTKGQETFKCSSAIPDSYIMTTISKNMEINAPISEVFTYFARPEHMADQFPENMGLSIIPLEVKNGFGVGTIFRISGDFDGKRLEWDCETIEYIPHRKIVAKMIEGPFKRWIITVTFEPVSEKQTSPSVQLPQGWQHWRRQWRSWKGKVVDETRWWWIWRSGHRQTRVWGDSSA